MASSRKAIHAPNAPAPNGNYSHVVRASGLLFLAGWMGDDPSTGKIVEGGIEAQTKQAIDNIRACLEAAGSCQCIPRHPSPLSSTDVGV